jgi:CrcB protein
MDSGELTVNKILLVALGGALGALTRYGLGLLINARWFPDFPLATFVINVIGSFVIGFFLTLADARAADQGQWIAWKLLIVTGFTGAFTTFSTFEYETMQLTAADKSGLALLYVMSSVILGFLAVWLGIVCARWFS